MIQNEQLDIDEQLVAPQLVRGPSAEIAQIQHVLEQPQVIIAP